MHIVFYKQAVYEKGTKIGKRLFEIVDCKMVIAMLSLLFNDSKGDNISTVQKTDAKKEMVEWDCHDIPLLF